MQCADNFVFNIFYSTTYLSTGKKKESIILKRILYVSYIFCNDYYCEIGFLNSIGYDYRNQSVPKKSIKLICNLNFITSYIIT